jgi:hypothetical protein
LTKSTKNQERETKTQHSYVVRVAAFVGTAGSVLVVISVVLDGILLIYAAIQWAKQRTALQEYGALYSLFIWKLSVPDAIALVVQSYNYVIDGSLPLESKITCRQQIIKRPQLTRYSFTKGAGQTEDQMKPVMDAMIQSLLKNLKSIGHQHCFQHIFSCCH